ncbi:hypothetical protein AX16_010426 [Volvariella volvacea WC 439]|nr:hypothetical protein AX16_010426 [Volvariella volvacea WC 439]
MIVCRDAEGWGPISPHRDFDLTICFEEGVVLPFLLLFLALGATWRIWVTSGSRFADAVYTGSRILWAKLILLSLSCALSTTVVMVILFSHQTVGVPAYYMLEPLALFLAACLAHSNHIRSRNSSTILLLFWPVYTASLGVWTRTISFKHYLPVELLILKWMTIVAGLLAFALELRAPQRVISLDELGMLSQENPVITANIFSRWTFGWMTPLMRKGAKQYITEEDLPALHPKDESKKLGEDLKEALAKHTLWKALFRAYGGPYAFAAGLKVIQDLLAFLQPQLLRYLLLFISRYQSARYSTNPRPHPLEGFSIAVIMFVASIMQTITLNQYFQRAFETGMRVRAGLVNVIYAKALVLSNDERGRSSGDIVNLMSVDATRLQDFCTYGLIAISGPLQIVLAFISLYNLLGWAAFVGVAIMICSIPLNTFIARILKRMQEQQMKNRDKRTRLMSELLANIKSIKLYAWEYTFMRRIFETRNDHELKLLKKIGVVTALNTTLWTGIPLLVAFSSFATAAATSSKALTADIIFPAISLFMLLQFPLAMFSQVTSNIIEAAVSISRLSSFLNANELQPDACKIIMKPSLHYGDEVLVIKDADFSWHKESSEPTLDGINLTLKKGELVGIFGRVGAGKSSLLSAIIGDMIKREGEVTLYGSIAYAPQNPWILSSTIRENIVFSHEYDETFYNLVIQACALEPDLALFPDGDLTEVGEKGITLSGGQRARIALARAVYARADLVLLDDCLAAVDSHVARHIFDNVIGPHGILGTKARILVTHSIAFVKQFDQLIFLRQGVILEFGHFDEITRNENAEISKLIRGHGADSGSGSSTPRFISGTATPESELAVTSDKIEFHSTGQSEKLKHRDSFKRATLVPLGPARLSGGGLSKEHIEKGRVKLRVYWLYIQAASKLGFSLFLLATVLQQAASVFGTLVLRAWGEHNQEVGDNSDMFRFLLYYGLFSLLSTLLGGLSSVVLWVFCTLRSARKLHDSMLNALMHAPLSYFELTPTGRVLNLFSRDIYVIDQVLARVIQGMFRTSAVCLSILVVIGASFSPFLIAVIPLGWFYLSVMKYYLATSRELKRLDAVSRSPIFAWFSESLAGLSTIRAFHQQSVFIHANNCRVDRNQMCYLPSIAVNRWLSVRLEFVGAMIIFIVSMLALSTLVTSGVDAGLVGLVLSYALNTTSSLNWVVRSASEVEQNIVSVERILHQTEVAPEAPLELEEQRPPSLWPSQGKVEFQDYSAKYRQELDLVLRNVSFVINPGEKVGICGRTGAGKSSLLLALFRIIEPTSGRIIIDSVNIMNIGLHDLRSAISIVPQSPDMFEGTLRENIDPVGVYPDDAIWQALDQVHLKTFVQGLSEGLDYHVHEGGSSLSAGQRQLLCFARALLRKCKILVLDEATSAVDLDTDQAIQEIIRGPAFGNMTILTIAHRLNTIIDYDRILVMSIGKVVEFDRPHILLDKKETLFYTLAQEAGLVAST